ncbi:MAG: hypothetical protein IANPNBLG_04627 [Bryobacteraceae bacterium]|nr:hypothetical protein [Bryobacteraceae bacterium]MCC6344668.1 MoaD/ThiS family protein [Bryobacterales bacterium]
MAVVYIPALLRPIVGREQVEVEAGSVRQIIDRLEELYPGVRERLVDGARLRSGVSVAIDGEVETLGILASVPPSSEVHFVLALSGG